jgi:hypothetical protein
MLPSYSLFYSVPFLDSGGLSDFYSVPFLDSGGLSESMNKAPSKPQQEFQCIQGYG